MVQWLLRLISGLDILPFVGSNPVADTHFEFRKMLTKCVCIVRCGRYAIGFVVLLLITLGVFEPQKLVFLLHKYEM